MPQVSQTPEESLLLHRNIIKINKGLYGDISDRYLRVKNSIKTSHRYLLVLFMVWLSISGGFSAILASFSPFVALRFRFQKQ